MSSRVDSLPEKEEQNEQDKTDDKDPRLIRAYYEVDFDKENNPLTIDCNQPGVICKLPVALPADGGLRPVRRHVSVVDDDAVPIIKGVVTKVDGKLNNENTEKTTDRVVLLVAKGDSTKPVKAEESGPPVYKGTLDDIEAVLSDIKDPETIAYLSKGYLHKPYVYRPSNGFVGVYNNRVPLPYDYLDHGRGVSPNAIPLSVPYGWTPWIRPGELQVRRAAPTATPPCHTTVINCNPCSCVQGKPSLATSHKPTINIDDKIDRD